MRSRWKCLGVVGGAPMGAAIIISAVLMPLESTAAAASTGNAPGVTSNSITVGTILTQTGTLAANASSVIYGERAYFNYINAQGGERT
jgi:ABC-type branched-subunit amino acid transport system substrate-binding protein